MGGQQRLLPPVRRWSWPFRSCCPASCLRLGIIATNHKCFLPFFAQVELALPELLSRIDFVTMDSNSGAVDNNG